MLKEKGVGFYLGYDESNNVGQRAGMLFFGKLASGMSVRNAYESLPNSCLHNTMSDNVYYWNPDLKVVEYGEKTWVADLVPFYSEKNVQIGASRITGPVLGEFKDNSNSVQLRVELQATSPLYTYHYQSYLSNADKIYGENFTFDKFRYGFEYGTKEDFSDATKTIGMAVNTPGCIHTENIVRYTQTLTSDKLTPSTTYYYRAYFYDGYDYYYTNSDTFTTKDLPVDTDTQLPDVPGSDF
jgi:hypothetical protein